MKRGAIERSSSGRSCVQLVVQPLVAALLVVAVGAGGLGAFLWRQQVDEMARLRARVDELAAGSGVAEVRATAASLDSRLAELERGLALAAQESPQPTGVPEVNPSRALAELSEGHAALTTRIEELERLVAGGVIEFDETHTAVAVEAPPGAVRLTVAAEKQQHTLSCESSAASMAARYHGIDVSEADILAALPRDDNPQRGFRGNVDGPPGGIIDYGVYAGPVAAVLTDYGLDARMVEGGLPGIQGALARGNPVVAWVTYDCLASTPVTETVAGEPVVLVPYQHAVVVTGYDGGGVWANDPWDGGEDYYARSDFERALHYFGEMAIEVATPGDEGTSR